MLLITYMVAALEHHVFKKVCKAAFANFFSCTAYMIGNIYMHYWIAMIFMQQNSEAIGQGIFFVRYYQFIALTGSFSTKAAWPKESNVTTKQEIDKRIFFMEMQV